MRVIVTAGPTREYIDDVRFITNASSGTMGYACAAAAVAAGHEVTLITGPVAREAPAGCEVVCFETVADLQAALAERFASCDALIMAAAVGDFSVERRAGKIPRSGGAVPITLTPSEDILATVAARRREQTIIAFALETERDEEKARQEMIAKDCDYVVVNAPAAIAADESEAAILSRDGVAAPWALRPKTDLAGEIIELLTR